MIKKKLLILSLLNIRADDEKGTNSQAKTKFRTLMPKAIRFRRYYIYIVHVERIGAKQHTARHPD